MMGSNPTGPFTLVTIRPSPVLDPFALRDTAPDISGPHQRLVHLLASTATKSENVRVRLC